MSGSKGRPPIDRSRAAQQPRRTAHDDDAPRRPAIIAPILSLLGLVMAAVLTIALFTGSIPILPTGSTNNQPDRTPSASAPPEPVKTAAFPGSIVYAKSGNLWLQTGDAVKQLTTSGLASMPTFSPDGAWIYYIETRHKGTNTLVNGSVLYYDLTYPVVCRIAPDGTGQADLLSGLYTFGSKKQYSWFYWIRQPVVAPNGTTMAFVSDGTDPSRRDVVLQLWDVKTRKLTVPALAENAPLGHQDPAWSPDGASILYVKNGRDGTRGAPVIYKYTLATKANVVLAAGYLAPSWSPDGKYVAVTKTTPSGTDVAILDASNGAEVARLTNDGRAWGPVWSPAGNAIVFLHMVGSTVDLRQVKLGGSAPGWTLADPQDLTEYSGLDGGSRPSWFVPADQMPAPSPSAVASGATGSTQP